MLSREDNELLCRTNAGTPMGELFRRFWLPALLPLELPKPDSDPIRFRILGEDLIAFRDTNGQVGFIQNNCPHRGASLFFGRNEEAGLRCVYHGWKFDVTGQCVDMPNEPAESNFKNKVRARAYPAAEFGGFVWIYMGPPDKKPPLPKYQWCAQPNADQALAAKWMQDSNYAQGLEGNIDSSHVEYAHRNLKRPVLPKGLPNASPQITVAQETNFGFVYGARRAAPEDQYYWRVTTYVLPTFTSIASESRGGGGFWVLPRDDETSWWFFVVPTPQNEQAAQRGHMMIDGLMTSPKTGLIPGTWRRVSNKDNDYLIDREMQRTENYTGILGRSQDGAVTESMGTIYDRTSEHLGTSDAAIIMMRRQMIKLAKQLQQGIEPPLLHNPEWYRALPMDVVTSETDFGRLWDAHHSDFLREAGLVAI